MNTPESHYTVPNYSELSPSSKLAVRKSLFLFVDKISEVAGVVVVHTSRKPNSEDPDNRTFIPTDSQSVREVGVRTGHNFLVFNDTTGQLDVVPPLPEDDQQNIVLYRAQEAANLAIASSVLSTN